MIKGEVMVGGCSGGKIPNPPHVPKRQLFHNIIRGLSLRHDIMTKKNSSKNKNQSHRQFDLKVTQNTNTYQFYPFPIPLTAQISTISYIFTEA